MFRDSDPNGIVRKSTGTNMLSSSLSSVFFSDTSSSIADAVQTTSPTAKAVKDYIDALQYLPVKDFIIPDPDLPDIPDITPLQTLTEALQSMLSPSNAIYYVDNASDADPDADGSLAHPFKTINLAVSKANLRRFVGNSNCYIRLISDYTVANDTTKPGNPLTIILYHPDLVQSKYLLVEGWNDNGTARQLRTIHYTAIAAEDYYRPIFNTMCNTTVSYIEFKDDGVMESSRFGDKETYAISNNNGNKLTVHHCKFIGAYDAIVGNSFELRDIEFDTCRTCIVATNSGTSRSFINGNIKAINCNRFVSGSFGAIMLITLRSEQMRIELSTYSMPFSIATGSLVALIPYYDVNGMATDENTYSGSDNWSFCTSIYDNSLSKYVRFSLSGDSASEVSSYYRKLANLSGNGYSDNGYFSINGTKSYLLSFTNFTPSTPLFIV